MGVVLFTIMNMGLVFGNRRFNDHFILSRSRLARTRCCIVCITSVMIFYVDPLEKCFDVLLWL